MALVGAIAAGLGQRRVNGQIRESQREREMERKVKFLSGIIALLAVFCVISLSYNFHKEGKT